MFTAALAFLLFAMKKPDATVRFCLRISLLERFAPRIARVIETKLLDMIRGFAVLRDPRNLTTFTIWTLVYWSANGLAVWVMAQAFHLELSLVGGFAVMGLVGVGISLPNSPGLVGQYQWFTLLGLSLYLGPEVMKGGTIFDVIAHELGVPHNQLHINALAYSIVQHLFQVIWYVSMGALGLASPWVSVNDLRHVRDATREPAAPP